MTARPVPERPDPERADPGRPDLARHLSGRHFPFAAIVGLDALKLALQLAAIDHRLSVLVRGDKGAGKSTAARALGDLLADESRFVNLPIGATEDRVLGGLDVEKALNGEPALKPGLLAAAHDGVLYIDEVNLLPDHLADAMLDAVASGVHIVEREGFSVRQEARFVLVGSMNPEEGTLRPQLLDRFALVVDVSAPMEPSARSNAVKRRMVFEADEEAFEHAWRPVQEVLRRELRRARHDAPSVTCSDRLLDFVSERVCAHGVRSLRADLAIVRASRALAALQGVAEVTPEHVEAVLPLALRHRMPPRSMPPPPPQAGLPPPAASDAPREDGDRDRSADTQGTPPDRVFDVREMTAPRLVLMRDGAINGHDEDASRRTGQRVAGAAASAGNGVVTHARPDADPRELDVRSTLVHAITQTGTPRVRVEDLHEKVRAPQTTRRFLFVVDASGSQAVHQRMTFVKGVVAGLLESSVRRRDEVALISFRGAQAELVLPPTTRAEDARAVLSYLPTGGRTPLAHALDLTAGLVTDRTVLVIVTDGRANVPTRTDDPWADALQAAAGITCPSLVIDSETGPNAPGQNVTGRARELAERLRGRYAALHTLSEEGLLTLVRQMPADGETVS